MAEILYLPCSTLFATLASTFSGGRKSDGLTAIPCVEIILYDCKVSRPTVGVNKDRISRQHHAQSRTKHQDAAGIDQPRFGDGSRNVRVSISWSDGDLWKTISSTVLFAERAYPSLLTGVRLTFRRPSRLLGDRRFRHFARFHRNLLQAIAKPSAGGSERGLGLPHRRHRQNQTIGRHVLDR